MRSLLLLLLSTAVAHAAVVPDSVAQIRGLIRDRKIAEAESAANALIAANPTEPEAYIMLGRVQIAKQNSDAAVAAYEKAVELVPKSGDYQLQLGDAYGFAAQKAGMLSKIGWAKKCRIAYEKAVELEPANLDARISLMSFYQQAPGVMGGGPEKAYEQAAQVKQRDANRGRIAFATLYAGEKKFTEAFTELDEALKATPDNYAALYQFGRLAAITGERVDQGIEALKKCLAITPSSGSPGHDAVNWRLGNLWEKKGDKAAARAAYQAALGITPTFPQAIESLKKLG